MKHAYIILFSLLLSCAGWTQPNAELTQFVTDEVVALHQGMAQIPNGKGSEFDLRRFLIRLQAKFGIEIPWLAKFQIIPEIEIVAQKEVK